MAFSCVKELIFFIFVYFISYFSSLKFNHKISYYEKVLLLICGFVMFSCSEELSQGEQRVETSEVSTEGTSLLVTNALIS